MKLRLFHILTILLTLIIAFPSVCREKQTDALTQLRSQLTKSEKLELRSQMSPYIKRLDSALAHAAQYRKIKTNRIELLKKRLRSSASDQRLAYSLCSQLTSEYSQYNSDSAITYAQQSIQLAEQINDRDTLAKAKIDCGIVYINGGYFRHCQQIINSIDTTRCSQITKVGYLLLLVELDYTDSFYRSESDNDALCRNLEDAYKQILVFRPEDSAEAIELRSKIASRQRKTGVAITELHKLLKIFGNDSTNYSITLGKIGFHQIDNMEIVFNSLSYA